MRGKGWRKCKLGDVGENFAMGPFGSNIKTENFIKSGIPVIRGKNLNFPKYVDGEFVFISEKKADELKNSNCFPDDIIVTHRGTLGQVCLISRKQYQRYIVSQSGMKFSTNPEKADCQFVFYYLKSDIGQHELLQHESQVGVPSISNPLTSLKSVNIFLPPLSEQKSIVSILSSLDDKIDLLHRQNKTLEALAETLFRQWFVEEADESWKEGTIDDIITVKGGTTPSTKIPEYWDGDIHWTTPKDLSECGDVFMLNTKRKITSDGLAQIGSGLLPIGSVLLSSRAPIGYLAIADIPVAINQGYIGIICDKIVSNWFIYLWCKENMELIKNSGNGSVFQEISKSTFKTLPVQMPTINVLNKFDIIVNPYFAKIKYNQWQIVTLETLRNMLLSRLMGGEVEII